MSIGMMGGALLEKILLRRLIPGIAGLLALAIIIGITIAALMATGLYLFYQFLILHGVSTDTALLSVSGVIMGLILTLCIVAIYRFRAIRKMLDPLPDVASHIGQTAEAFVSGLLTPSPHKD